MVIISALLAGIAAFLLSHLCLEWQKRRELRSSVKARFIAQAPEKGDGSILRRLPFLKKAAKRRQERLTALRSEAELPRMLDILAMGMNAGLNFDTAFGLYVQRFDTELAVLCRERFELWERGLITRDDGLGQLASRVMSPLFDRFCRTATRSIRHGIPMAPLIKEYADQARKEYRNKQKEKVLKAPVKMLLPTGVLILPAMMMLVIGPILLDVTGRIV